MGSARTAGKADCGDGGPVTHGCAATAPVLPHGAGRSTSRKDFPQAVLPDARRRSRPAPVRAADRPVCPGDHLSARLGDRPVRFPLRLLHGRRHDLPAEVGGPVDRGAGAAVPGIRAPRRAQIAADRRRAPGPPRGHDPDRTARSAAGPGRAGRADAHDQRQPAGQTQRCAGARRRAPGQRFARYARPGEIHRHYPLGQAGEGAGRLGRRQGRRPCHQDQHGCAEGRERGRTPPARRMGRRGRAST